MNTKLIVALILLIQASVALANSGIVGPGIL